MKKYSFLMGLCLMVLLMAPSCTTISKTGQAAPFAYTEVHPDKIKAEMDFNLEQKSTGKASAWYVLWFWKVSGDNKFAEVKGSETRSSLFGGRIARVKSAAIYNALGKADYDLLVNPQYDSEIKSYLFGLIKGYKVNVKGYGAKIKNLYQEKE
jgi:hypothetical protein